MRDIGVGIALAALIAAAPRAQAQRVRGTLTDSVTRGAVSGAVVASYDSAGRGLSRALTDSRGTYSVERLPATRKLRIVHIGFRPRELTLGPADSIVDVQLQPIPALLHDVRASADRVCPAETNTGTALDVWEQARAGLLASVVSRESSPPHVELRTYRRTLDPVTRKVFADTTEFSTIVDGRSFVAAKVPWSFAIYGYMREGDDGTRDYYAPDEKVLLDPSFAETHCLHLIDGRGPRETQIGVAFDPIDAPGRDTIVDLTGALWLDRATFAPQTIEFSYTSLESANRDAGGEVNFTVMPNGVSMIDRWEIRSASIAIDRPSAPGGLSRRNIPRRDRQDVRVLAYRRVGGQIASARWPDGKQWLSDLPRIQGLIRTRDDAPVAGAFVWIMNSPDTVRTDASGYFRFPPMRPGVYAVSASDSVLARLGVSRVLATRATLLTIANTNLTFTYFPRSEIFPTICPARSYRVGTGVMLARVVDAAGAAVAEATVEVETHRTDSDSLRGAVRYTTTGDDGRFVVCGAERDQRLIVRAFKDERADGVAIDQWGEEVVSVTLRLKPIKP